ncbi:zinc-dependent metalloprotease [Natronomonas marina]|uniref:zinc-dependent metalloprotease n=1 Tax=Natronomonas marina TaxID=2961939 RepID=UPI0020C96A98|nr:zinc-dependent metalloprotease [Natronomonas marina]
MSLYRAVRAVADSEGDGPVDWAAVGTAAREGTDAGDLTLSEAERRGYADDVGDARDAIRETAGLEFDLPENVQVQNRHHWIDANLVTFERLLAPLEERTVLAPSLARSANTGSMAVTLGFLANNVLGQYDPLLLSDGDHGLYFVHPNIETVAAALDVDRNRFRRWIAFHEVAHAAEFGAAPWLSDRLETAVREAVSELADGNVDREALGELDVTMTAVEGYAELVMDRAFDREYADLREKLDARRGSAGPISMLLRRLLGLGRKRRQYERGKAFFDAVAEARGVAGAAVVWDAPGNLPTDEELDDPDAWLARVGPRSA